MILIESNEHFEEILSSDHFVMIPILEFPKIHFKKNILSFIYGLGRSSKEEFLYNCNHYDYPKIELKLEALRTPNHICFNKRFLPFYDSILDGGMVLWFDNVEQIPNFFENRISSSDIPIYKWIDALKPYLEQITIRFDISELNSFRQYDNFINQLIKIEYAGLFIDIANVHPDNRIPRLEYTEYNPYTATGRPSNRFGGVNYSALNKSDGSRKKYVSRFQDGYLVEFDYEAYHIHLISKLIGYSFSENPYLTLAREIFKIENPSLEDISNVKTIVFSQVYGGVRYEYETIDFFRKLNEFLNRMKKQYQRNSLQTILFKKSIKSEDSLIKTFNYILQNLETELNSIILTKIHTSLIKRNSKCILYTYDSFLFDIHPAESEIICELKQIIESINVPCKIKKGVNYGELYIL